VLRVGGVQGGLAVFADLFGGAVVHGRRCVPADPGVTVLVVVGGEEFIAECAGVGERAEPVRKVGHVFHGFELGFGVRVVVRGARPGMRT
jgi:hypothetical protein